MKLDPSFRSGMSSKSDLRGAMDANTPVGVVAGNLTTSQLIMSLPHYLNRGGRVFIDSGAFAAERTNAELDWDEILAKYLTIAELTDHPENLFVVAPDKIGKQIETLALLRVHQESLQTIARRGANIIIPLQCGNPPAATMLAAVREILGHNLFIAGIPSNKAAMSIIECRTLRHHAFHILGRVQVDECQAARVSALCFHNPMAQVSADANWLRSRLDLVRKLTIAEKETPSPSPMLADHPRVRAIRNAILGDGVWGNARRAVI
jgi:hypothetical protein